MLQRSGIVVPFGEVAHRNGRVLSAVVPFDPRPAQFGGHGVADDDIDRHAIAPGIVERHGGVMQANRPMREDAERLSFDFVITMAHRDRDFLMRAGEEFGILVAAIIDWDSCRPRKLEAGFAAMYSKPRLFRQSIMKSLPLLPSVRTSSAGGGAVSATLFGSGTGLRAPAAGTWATAFSGAVKAATPARPAPFKNPRRPACVPSLVFDIVRSIARRPAACIIPAGKAQLMGARGKGKGEQPSGSCIRKCRNSGPHRPVVGPLRRGAPQ